MPLEDFLAPGESIHYRSPTKVEYQGDLYGFYITDRRLIWHKREGLVLKKDKFVSEVLENVEGIKYYEKGVISKKGFIEIQMKNKKLTFSGPVQAIRAIYSEMQAYMKPSD